MSTLNVSLAPDVAQIIEEKVGSGMYPSANDVIREGLRLLNEQEAVRQMRLHELRREIQKGVDSLERGDAKVFHSGEELAAHIEAQGRKLLAEKKPPR